jgi:hypothetical protein
MYGFRKSKGIIKEGEAYEHEKFCAKSTNEEINKIVRQSKKMKVLANYIKSAQKEDTTNDTDFLSNGNENDVLKYLYEKNEENQRNSLALKKEMEDLRKENSLLNQEIDMIKSVLNSHKLLLEKIIKKNNDTQASIKKNTGNIKSLNDLFNKYLYFLRIYSPYVDIENNTFTKQKTEKTEEDNEEIEKVNEINEKKDLFDNNITKIESNVDINDNYDELSMHNNIFPLPDLNLPNNFSSRSFSRFFK